MKGHRLFINGVRVTIDPTLWTSLSGHKLVKDGASCNGCGPESSFLAQWLIPDKVCGVSVEGACAIHDAMCDLGGGPDEFLGTSTALGANVEASLLYGRVPGWLARFTGHRYRAAVHILGPSAFRWSDSPLRSRLWRGMPARVWDILKLDF